MCLPLGLELKGSYASPTTNPPPTQSFRLDGASIPNALVTLNFTDASKMNLNQDSLQPKREVSCLIICNARLWALVNVHATGILHHLSYLQRDYSVCDVYYSGLLFCYLSRLFLSIQEEISLIFWICAVVLNPYSHFYEQCSVKTNSKLDTTGLTWQPRFCICLLLFFYLFCKLLSICLKKYPN